MESLRSCSCCVQKLIKSSSSPSSLIALLSFRMRLRIAFSDVMQYNSGVVLF
ncbi:unnamed protein product [Periconia digitata]|uniref:Uncharacterized protein n=1 Tax=Periconia digitata TaxID=1303443 RepID=A0A9W4XWK3_9PLEO|nr:unnamed protein product [Periconia digitata]